MVNLMEIYKSLPALNCGKCGVDTCMGFASKLLKGDTKIADCTPILEKNFASKKEQLETMLEGRGKSAETGIIINEDRCTGCGNCVISCPVAPMNDPAAGGGKDPESTDVVFRVKKGRVRIVNLKKCRRFGEDKRCRICADSCPYDVIDFA